MGALALTHTPKYREPFEPLPGDVDFVPFGDVEALRAAVDEATAAILIETVQGENGGPAPGGYLAEARAIADGHGSLLWIDEVQTGLGRCGEWLAHRADSVVADLVTLAKGLGNGFPIGACLASGAALDLLNPACTAPPLAGTRWRPQRATLCSTRSRAASWIKPARLGRGSLAQCVIWDTPS